MLYDANANEIGSSEPELSDKEIEELLFVAKMRSSLEAKVRLVNDHCWDICVSKPGTKLDKNSETCLGNCTNRFLDVTKFIIERFSHSIQKMGNNM